MKKQAKNPDLNIVLSDVVKTYEFVSFKSKKAGDKKVSFEGKFGSELHTESGEMRKIERLISREGNSYDEVITDTDGKIIREVHQPLTSHINRGSASKPQP